MSFLSKLLLGKHRSRYQSLTCSSTTFPSKTGQFGTRQLPRSPRARDKQSGVLSAKAQRTLQHSSKEQGSFSRGLQPQALMSASLVPFC